MVDPQAGLLVRTVFDTVVWLCYPAPSNPTRWYCSDGWAYKLEALTLADPTDPATIAAQQERDEAAALVIAWADEYHD